MDFTRVDVLIDKLEKSIEVTNQWNSQDELLVGVDLGTAYIVLVVLDQWKNPVACEIQFAQVIKDGLVVDYIGARTIVSSLKEKLEKRLGVQLNKAAIAIPPGTGIQDTNTHRYVVEGAGFEVTNILDEPTAANTVLSIKNGVVVDIGGGTTGLAIFKNGEVIYTADEATGGTHLTLVVAGSYKIKFEEAEVLKKMKERSKDIFTVVTPVIQKIAYIIRQHIQGFDVDCIYLVGGTCCLEEIEKVIQKETGIKTIKPNNPFLITPLGIAMNCKI